MSEDTDDLVDDKQTDQESAHEMLKVLCEKAFGGDVDATSLALGRERSDVQGLIDLEGSVDDDLAMKIRGLAEQRGIDLG
jgi:hypothetical protein